MPASDRIVISGARAHNLKGIDLELPRDALLVITGLSGSGKSSLAFDTIYAEGQRRYVESLSAYARQFLGQMEKPDVDSIEGLSPAISIDQKTTSRNPRSTVGTVTEIYDYLRLLYARIGKPHCPVCGRPISGQSQESIVDQILQLPEGTRFTVNAPVVRDRKGEYKDVFEHLQSEGFSRVKVDGEQHLLEDGVPALHRARPPAGDRSRPARARPDPFDRRGRARALGARQLGLLRIGHPGDRRSLRDRPRAALAGPLREGAEPVPVRHRRRADLRLVPEPDGPAPRVHDGVRGARPEPGAPLPGHRFEPAARADRGVHELPALPGLPRRAPEAGGARGHGRRAQHPPVHADVGHARARVSRSARA